MGVAPVVVTVISPSLSPKQEGSVKDDVLVSCVGSVIVTVRSSVQSLSSSISIVYVPAVKLENILEDCQVVPLLIEY